MSFYQVAYEGGGEWGYRFNRTREEALLEFACPFITREVTLFGGRIFNPAANTSLEFFQTERPVDSDWPVRRSDAESKDKWEWDKHATRVAEFLKADAQFGASEELFREAIILIESGGYTDQRRQIAESLKGREAFMVSPLGNTEVDYNYQWVIQPAVRSQGFEITRVDEISHTGNITDLILDAINRSRFVVADLTDERPNCYYEVGYAHAQGKPVIILAKEGTQRHFDISTYRWNHWRTHEDLKPVFERELASVLQRLGLFHGA